MKKNNNETFANLWRTVDRSHQQQIETKMLKENEGFLFNYVKRRKPPPGYWDICFSAIKQSIIPALNGWDESRSLKFLTYWIWWIQCEYNKIISEEVGLFPFRSVQRKTTAPIDISICTTVRDGITLEDTLRADKQFSETQLCHSIDTACDTTTAQVIKYIIAGYTRKETATMLGISIGTVCDKIFRNRRKIKEIILGQ